jgi:hypothetical protein
VGAAAYRKDWDDLLSLFPGPITASISDLDVTAGGADLAWSHSIQTMEGTMKNRKKMDLTVRVTNGYKRVNGHWLIALEHVSVPVDVLTGKADLTSSSSLTERVPLQQALNRLSHLIQGPGLIGIDPFMPRQRRRE